MHLGEEGSDRLSPAYPTPTPQTACPKPWLVPLSCTFGLTLKIGEDSVQMFLDRQLGHLGLLPRGQLLGWGLGTLGWGSILYPPPPPPLTLQLLKLYRNITHT